MIVLIAVFFNSRHTRAGSLKVCIYEGARNLDLATIQKIDMTDISTADVVLTTYDVLKEDLSHDGDRRFLRFQKRQVMLVFTMKVDKIG